MSDGADIMSSVPRDKVRVNSLIYVLVTPARNEALFIEDTIRSVVAQTNRPLRWVIVSDGSTDGTDEIVKRYAKDNSWIEFVRVPPRRERDFAGKVRAFSAGYARLQKLRFDVVGSLDADISFDEDYFELLLAKFAKMPRLGVAGTPFREGERQYDFRFASIEHVSGACQVFRRECFDMIGGYRPVRGGGIDWIAVTTARMRGWQTRTFLDTHCRHNRPIGTASTGVLDASFKLGQKDYRLGGHPVWELFRGIYQMRSRPYGLRGLTLMSGYFWDFVRGAEKSVDIELQRFHRKEQVQRLKKIFSRYTSWRRTSVTRC